MAPRIKCLTFLSPVLMAGMLTSGGAIADQTLALGQPVPTDQALRLGSGVISTDDHPELNAVFYPDGTEFYFCRLVDGVYRLFVMRKTEEGGWSSPARVVLKSMDDYEIVDPWVTPDGKKMFYISNAPSPEFAEGSVNIWVMARDSDSWGPPELLPAPVNSDAAEVYPVPVDSSALYFSSTRNQSGRNGNVYVAKQRADGRYDTPEKIGQPVSTNHREGDIFVAPDESYLIVTSHRPGGYGKADMYISYRAPDGSWGEAKNLGPKVNSEDHDYTPVVSPDGRFFFFTRGGDIHWIATSAIGITSDN